MSATRRDFLAAAAVSAALLPASAHAAENAGAAHAKRLEGIFPIVQTPFTDSGAFDAATLGDEVEFLHKIGVQGMTWPVNASEYSQLTFDERLAGAEAIVKAAQIPSIFSFPSARN